jgi:hypothetical protein
MNFASKYRIKWHIVKKIQEEIPPGPGPSRGSPPAVGEKSSKEQGKDGAAGLTPWTTSLVRNVFFIDLPGSISGKVPDPV